MDESKQKYRLFYSVEDDFNQDSEKEQEEFFEVEKDEEEDEEKDEIEEIDCNIGNLEVD